MIDQAQDRASLLACYYGGLNLMLSDQALLGLDLQGNINLEDYLLAVMINFEIGL